VIVSPIITIDFPLLDSTLAMISSLDRVVMYEFVLVNIKCKIEDSYIYLNRVIKYIIKK
jgi:hypothetical protein